MSANPEPTPTWQIAALVGRIGTDEILVEAHTDPVHLPMVPERVAIEPFAADAVAAIAGLIGADGAPVVPLRLTWLPVDDWTAGTIVVEVEPWDPAPPGFRWLDPEAVLDVLEPEAARPVVRRRRLGVGSDPTANPPPWTRPGWSARTSAWMIEQLSAAGLPATEAPHLVYQGPLATVLRARCDDRAVYLKCAAKPFIHEASITHALARGAGDRVPAVIASDADENWLLMHDHGGRLLDAGAQPAWVDAMAPIGELQRHWIGATGTILAAGGQHRPLDSLAEAAPAMLDRGGFGDRMPADLRAAWVAALPRLIDGCAALADLGVPDTLVHGDLHPGNVVVGSSGHVIVDWSDAAVSHPFIDLPTFLLRTDDIALRHRLRDAYLDGWDGIRPRPRLETAVDLAMAVGSLYQVATYQALLPALDTPDRALFDGVDVNWARRTLDALERGLEASFP